MPEGQVLEVPSVYGGGAGYPSPIPAPSTQLDYSIAKGLNKLLGSPRRALVNMLDRKTRGDCCPCPGQQPYRSPFDQTPYSEPPGLNQPMRPQKPFQPADADPCDEALKRMGLTPAMFKKCLGQGTTRRKKSSSPRTTGKRKRTRRLSAAAANAIFERDMRQEMLTAAEKRFLRSQGIVPWDEKGSTTSRKRLAGRRVTRARKAPARRSLAPRVKRGKYQLLQNGACYDPVTRKFVKRALCR
jgi:hypothetical protein